MAENEKTEVIEATEPTETEAGADTTPLRTVALAGFRVSPVSFILLCVLLGVGIAEAAVRQLGAAGIFTGFLGFPRHKHSSTKREAPMEFPADASLQIFTNTSLAHIFRHFRQVFFW